MSTERKSVRLVITVLASLLLLLGLTQVLAVASNEVDPMGGPSDASLYSPPGYRQVVIAGGTPVAADTNYTSQIGQGYDYLDMFYVIDQDDAATNTLDLELEVSYDAITFYNHNDNPVVLDDNEADASGYVDSIPLHGYGYRIVANLTNTNTVTITLKGVVR